MAQVYRHRRVDNLEVFYIGMTTKTYGREHRNFRSIRSKEWHEVNDISGCIVEIVADDITDEAAYELEELLIQEYGRKDLGLGNLVNKTNGGYTSYIRTDVHKLLISIGNTGNKHTQEWKDTNSKRMMGNQHTKGMFLGDDNPAKRPEVRKKISEAVSGEKNGFYGKKHTEEVLNKLRNPSDEWKTMMRKKFGTHITFRGVEYDSYNQCSKETGVSNWLIKKEINDIKR